MEGGVLAGTSLPQAQLNSRGAGVAWGTTAFGRVLDRGGELTGSMVPDHCFCQLDVILYGVRCILPGTTLMASQAVTAKAYKSHFCAATRVPLCGDGYMGIDVLWLKANSYKRTDTWLAGSRATYVLYKDEGHTLHTVGIARTCDFYSFVFHRLNRRE